jgi:DNA-binding response OmpR family regulator
VRHILLVEDHSETASALAKLLNSLGYRVTLARTFLLAQQRLHDMRFDAVVLDVRLPDGNGLDLIRDIRVGESSIPCIAVGVMDGKENIDRALAAGVNDYMVKPVTLAQLGAVMDRYAPVE